KPKEKKSSEKHTCLICVSSRTIGYYRLSKDAPGESCNHFQGICTYCIQKLLKTKIVDGNLTEAELKCPFPTCDYALDMVMLKRAVLSPRTGKAVLELYDKALLKNFLANSPEFIVCISPTCGQYFCIEGCLSDTDADTKQKITCPECQHDLCFSCYRSWHPDIDCNKFKQEEEDIASIKHIKAMGAKQCPKCGINIEKDGGCSHMRCNRCRHNFCWDCLVPYAPGQEHLEGCPHRRPNIAGMAANWAPHNMTNEELNHLIAEAHRFAIRGFEPEENPLIQPLDMVQH
ncbi:hypothetical protein GQ44DRAFT_586017, partial [Phaeosphaeriaceae sp. PMI808]